MHKQNYPHATKTHTTLQQEGGTICVHLIFAFLWGSGGGGVIIFLTFYIINISRGCIHTLVQIQNLKILHKKKLILKSLYFYTYIKRTPKYKPELPSLCSRRDHTEYTGSILLGCRIQLSGCVLIIYTACRGQSVNRPKYGNVFVVKTKH